jgi:putative transposase
MAGKRYQTGCGLISHLFSSRKLPARRGRDIWQRRYWEHQIRDETDWQAYVDYIHFNPVKHGYVQRVSEWLFSSFHHYVHQGLLPPDWAGAAVMRGLDE